VSYFVSPNGGTNRVGTLTVAGTTVTVTQAGLISCSASISPASQTVAAAGGSGSITVTTQSGCGWAAASNAPWLTITSGASGTDSGTVSFSVAANTGASSRTGTLTIAGNTFTVTQAGTSPCSPSISPASQSVPTAGGSGTISVTAASGCAWTASSDSGWVTINSGANGSGNGTVGFSAAANTGTSSRTATLTVAGQQFTVTQAGASCNATVSPMTIGTTANGGSGLITVTTTAGCAWTAVSNDGWISVTSGGTGSGAANYYVTPNSNPTVRTGTLTVAGKTITVTQDPLPPPSGLRVVGGE